MNIDLHIERLVLEGIAVSHADRARLQNALETELVRLLSSGGLNRSFEAGIALPSVKAGNIEMKPGQGAAELGRQIAQAVYGGMSQ